MEEYRPNSLQLKLYDQGWFAGRGAYVLVDGQFGSTGKGLLAAFMASVGRDRITVVTSNAGPNSGHTAYLGGPDDDGPVAKVVTQQVPVASVFLTAMGYRPMTLINAGAIIDSDIMADEVHRWLHYQDVLIHPNAVVINENDKIVDADTMRRIAGTGKGIGPAMMAKVGRHRSLAGAEYMPILPASPPMRFWDNFWDWSRDIVFVETAQGFSLGINSQFYPYVTSRECTVMQALSDARIPAQKLQKVAMCVRTYPIRVGNTEGSSGPPYGDQEETTWEAMGKEPELTTVTKRVRRVFTWSREQFRDACAANRPDLIFLNFANYCSRESLEAIINWIDEDYQAVVGRPLEQLLLGYGPLTTDIRDFIEDA